MNSQEANSMVSNKTAQFEEAKIESPVRKQVSSGRRSTRKKKSIGEGKRSLDVSGNFDSDEFEDALCEALDRSYIETPIGYATALTSLRGEDDQEPLERDALPWLKDPKTKPSFWTILKDSIGKDLSHMGVPVYFNDPTSLLQKCA